MLDNAIMIMVVILLNEIIIQNPQRTSSQIQHQIAMQGYEVEDKKTNRVINEGENRP